MTRLIRILACLLLAGPALAEEGGSGHYVPGSMASFIDGVSPTESLAIRYNLLFYEGSAGAERTIPIASQVTLGADVSSVAHGLTIFWRPPVELGGRWSYAMSATMPYITLDVDANVVTEGGTVRRADEVDDIGDLILMPLMLDYQANEDLNWTFRLAFYAPTGDYEVGRLANTSKNFWSVDPTVSFMYFGKKNGRELSAFLGATFNQENSDTDYKSGTQVHLDVTAAQHFPAFGSLAGVGLTGSWYEQVSGDSGAGATLGDFKAQTIGAGPVVSLIRKVGGHDLLAELKWIHEFEVENRPEGDTVFLKILYKFY